MKLLKHSGFQYLLLFACAYGGFVAYFISSDGSQLSLPKHLISAVVGKQILLPDASSKAVSYESEQTARLQPSSLSKDGDSAVNKTLAVTPLDSSSSDKTQQELHALNSAAITAQPSERAKAVVALKNLGSTPESVSTLTTVLSTDQIIRNRILAINTLRQWAARGDEDDAIRAILHRAAGSNSDPHVARLAQQAYESLERHDSQQLQDADMVQ